VIGEKIHPHEIQLESKNIISFRCFSYAGFHDSQRSGHGVDMQYALQLWKHPRISKPVRKFQELLLSLLLLLLLLFFFHGERVVVGW
jgi:hypothetical protein